MNKLLLCLERRNPSTGVLTFSQIEISSVVLRRDPLSIERTLYEAYIDLCKKLDEIDKKVRYDKPNLP